jgi:DNA-binding MarR family transcriptional regulator
VITDASSYRQATDEEIDWWLQAETLVARGHDRISAELRRFGLTQTAYLTLDRLARINAPLRIAELASSVHLSPSSSRLVDRLVGEGYVTRSVCASDRRGLCGHLTAHGRAMHGKAGPYHRAALAQIIDHHILIAPQHPAEGSHRACVPSPSPPSETPVFSPSPPICRSRDRAPGRFASVPRQPR